mgnify:CR=1 FL=1
MLPPILIPSAVSDVMKDEAILAKSFNVSDGSIIPGAVPSLKLSRPRLNPVRPYNKSKRKLPNATAQAIRPAKFKKLMDTKTLGEAFGKGCDCPNDCFGSKTPSQPETEAKKNYLPLRHRNKSMTEKEVTQWIMDTLRPFNPHRNGKMTYRIGTQTVCKRAFLLIHGISEFKLKCCRRLLHDNKNFTAHASTGGKCCSSGEKKTWLESWVLFWLRINADQLITGYFFVPYYLRKADVHKEMVDEWCSEKGIENHVSTGNGSSSGTCNISTGTFGNSYCSGSSSSSSSSGSSSSSSSSSSSYCSSSSRSSSSSSSSRLSSSSSSSSSTTTTTTATTTATTTTATTSRYSSGCGTDSSSSSSGTSNSSDTSNSKLNTASDENWWSLAGLPKRSWPPSRDLLNKMWARHKVVFPTRGIVMLIITANTLHSWGTYLLDRRFSVMRLLPYDCAVENW